MGNYRGPGMGNEMDLDTIKKTLKIVIQRLIQVYNPEKIILFGSFAYGVPTSDSDLDLMIVVKDSALPQFKRSRAGYAQLHDIAFPIELLVMTSQEMDDLQQVKTSLAHQCLTKGRILYGSKKAA